MTSPSKPPAPSSPEKGLAALVGPALVMSLTLGLAPFVPEPHLLGKLRWIAGGAEGMGPMDWFDVLLHGGPWVLLIVSGVAWVRQRR